MYCFSRGTHNTGLASFNIAFVKMKTQIFPVSYVGGKVMVTYTKLQQRNKEESKRLRGEREIGCSLLI